MRVIAIVVAILWIILDQFSKHWAIDTLAAQPIVVNGWMNFSLAFNPGAAFSFLANHSGWQRWLFTGLASVISVWLIYAIFTERKRFWTLFGYGSILGGALGNAYDRIAYGHVVDFIQWHYKGYYWPTFNIADTAITIGVVSLIIGWLLVSENADYL